MSVDVKRIRLDYSIGMVRCFSETTQILAVHKEQLNIEVGEDLEVLINATVTKQK